MINKMVVQKALKSSLNSEFKNGKNFDYPLEDQDSVISLLIYDIFGGEILKTHKKRGWHFYNRIEGKRVDFTKSKIDKKPIKKSFEDIPSSPDETSNYFEREDYSTLFTRFVRAYEEVVGLKKYRHLGSA